MKQMSVVEQQASDKLFAKMLNKAKRQVELRRRNNKAHNDNVGARKAN